MTVGVFVRFVIYSALQQYVWKINGTKFEFPLSKVVNGLSFILNIDLTLSLAANCLPRIVVQFYVCLAICIGFSSVLQVRGMMFDIVARSTFNMKSV